MCMRIFCKLVVEMVVTGMHNCTQLRSYFNIFLYSFVMGSRDQRLSLSIFCVNAEVLLEDFNHL